MYGGCNGMFFSNTHHNGNTEKNNYDDVQVLSLSLSNAVKMYTTRA